MNPQKESSRPPLAVATEPTPPPLPPTDVATAFGASADEDGIPGLLERTPPPAESCLQDVTLSRLSSGS